MRIGQSNLVSSKTLLIFTVIGFLTGFDYTDSWGCVVFPHFFFSTPLSLLSLVSIIVFYIGNNSSNSKFVRKLILAEFVFYIFRLIIFKGGYEVGFGGTPDPIILFYDVIAVGLRIFLLKQLYSIKLHSLIGGVIVVVLLSLKSLMFAIPPYYYYQEQRDISKGRKLQTEMIGNYFGKIEYTTKEDKNSQNIAVKIKEDSIVFESKDFELAGSYFFLLESKNFGLIRNRNYSSSFYLSNFEEDKLSFEIQDNKFEFIEFELKKEKNRR